MKTSFINNQSLKIRFLVSLFVNILRIGLGFAGGIVIARGLGPAGYGNYSFLLGSFASVTTLINMGTSSAFYTFLSQKKRSSKFYLYYFLWIGIQFIIILSLVTFIFPDRWLIKIWLGHSKKIIILAFMASFMMDKVWETISHAGESIRSTVVVQIYNIVIAGLYLCIVLVMAFLKYLTISNLFIVITFTYLLLSFMLAKRLKDNLIAREEVSLPNVISEFKTYCAPLAILGIVGFLYSFADVWLLQKFSGAVQQGFYSIGLRFSAICLIATTAMLKVFWKETAEANESGDKKRLHYLYTKISRALCFIGAAGACFLVPFSREILVFLLGPKYEAGWLCLAIMFLYPIHQSLGQINGTYFYAISQTKLRSKLSIFIMIISIPVTYFLLAPRSALIPGLALGSVGLALKMVVLQIIGVNVLVYYLSRISGWKFDFLYQFETIGILLIASFAIKGLLQGIFYILNILLHPLLLILFSMQVYILVTVLVIYFFPQIAGLESSQITNALRLWKRFLGNGKKLHG